MLALVEPRSDEAASGLMQCLTGTTGQLEGYGGPAGQGSVYTARTGAFLSAHGPGAGLQGGADFYIAASLH